MAWTHCEWGGLLKKWCSYSCQDLDFPKLISSSTECLTASVLLCIGLYYWFLRPKIILVSQIFIELSLSKSLEAAKQFPRALVSSGAWVARECYRLWQEGNGAKELPPVMLHHVWHLFQVLHTPGKSNILLSGVCSRNNGWNRVYGTAAHAQGIMVALKMKFYFYSLCTSLDIALPKIIPPPLSPDELLENTTGKTTFKL